jgi:carotenoid 1,2-hydratase
MRCGRSSVSVKGNELRVIVDERTAPLGRRLCGEVKVYAAASNDEAFFLDQGHQHQWQPIVPGGQVVVEFEKPQIQWQGHAYVDTNNGRRPLESDFRRWDWSRYLAGDQTRILYKTEDLAGESRCLSLSFDQDARVSNIDAPREVELPRTGWGVERRMQHDADVRVIKTLEDTPFYARSMLGLSAGDNELTAMHESLTLERFRKTWVRTLLPFRMPRITR